MAVRPTWQHVEGGGIGAAIASAIALVVEKLLHGETVPLELHQRLFEEMMEALKVCQQLGP